jgi:5'-methylthioadenosine phosphorylase
VADHRIGVIGGSGLYELEGFEIRERRSVTTPFGTSSDDLVLGTLEGRELVFLPRHGRGHRFSPSQVPYRANIFAMKALGVSRIISVSAVGSMKEEIKPGHLVLPDQFIDRTVDRPRTFFDNGIVAHVTFADPICPDLRGNLRDAADGEKVVRHDGGAYICTRRSPSRRTTTAGTRRRRTSPSRRSSPCSGRTSTTRSGSSAARSSRSTSRRRAAARARTPSSTRS